MAIREFRKRKQLTQEHLAFDSGFDRTYISILELGTKSPTLDTVFSLCEVLGITFTELAQRVDAILHAAEGAT